jgi:septum formation topological specificity factor MinE
VNIKTINKNDSLEDLRKVLIEILQKYKFVKKKGWVKK